MQKESLTELLAFLQANWSLPDLNVSFIAKQFGCSISYLRERCWLQHKTTPSRLIENVRLEKALKLLCSCDPNLFDICRIAGHSCIRTLQSQFKKRLGISPAEFKILDGDCDNHAALLKGYIKRLWDVRKQSENY